MIEEKCGAVIWFGPGHQSKGECERTESHFQHRFHRPGGGYVYWTPEEGYTDFFDMSPEYESEDQ